MLIDFQKTATKIQYTNLLDMIRNKTIFQTFVFKPKSFFYSLFSIFFLHFSILYTDFNHSHGFFVYFFGKLSFMDSVRTKIKEKCKNIHSYMNWFCFCHKSHRINEKENLTEMTEKEKSVIYFDGT